MDDFKALLNKQIQKATATVAPEDKPTPKSKPQPAATKEPLPTEDDEAAAPVVVPEPTRAASPQRTQKKAGKGSAGRNINRVTVNLFEADSRALGVIRELLGSAGHDFSSRSDSMKVGLRLAAKAKPEELAKLFDQVKAEDRRFRTKGE